MKHLLALALGLVSSFAASDGYAQQDFSKTDPIEIANFLCMAEVKLTKAQEHADNLNNHFKDGTPLSQVALHEASYLPAGFPQTNPGYDSCMLTGVGYYFDMDNKRQFNNCDPEAPRYFEVDCRNITARIVELEDERGGRSGGGAGVTGNYKVMPFDPRFTEVCPEGMGRSARVNGRDDEEEKIIYETPK